MMDNEALPAVEVLDRCEADLEKISDFVLRVLAALVSSNDSAAQIVGVHFHHLYVE